MTETDKACEELILGRLRAAFPAHCFIGEEETAAAGGVLPAITDAPTWMVDPLDGTTNFVHRFPFSCVCVGLAVGKQPVVGVVHCPILKETFHAARGKGAFLNGERIEVSRTSEAQKALVATEIGVARDPAVMNNIMRRVRAVCEVRPAPVGSPWLAYTDHTSAWKCALSSNARQPDTSRPACAFFYPSVSNLYSRAGACGAAEAAR